MFPSLCGPILWLGICPSANFCQKIHVSFKIGFHLDCTKIEMLQVYLSNHTCMLDNSIKLSGLTCFYFHSFQLFLKNFLYSLEPGSLPIRTEVIGLAVAAANMLIPSPLPLSVFIGQYANNWIICFFQWCLIPRLNNECIEWVCWHNCQVQYFWNSNLKWD